MLLSLNQNIIEALDLALLTVIDAKKSRSTEDIEIALTASSPRSNVLTEVRRTYLESEGAMELQDRALLFSITAAFERAIWTFHRFTEVLSEERD